MAYFRNNAVNLLNLHYGIHAIAQYGGGAFFTVYLLKSGVPVPGVLAALALILAGRFVVRPLVVPLAVRYGVRPLLIFGTLLAALQFPLLAEVEGIGLGLLALCVLASVSDAFYWTTYHAYFAALGDAEHRGHQIGLREAVVALVGIVTPLVTAAALVGLGPRIAFGISAAMQIFSAAPLLFTPNMKIAADVPNGLRAGLRGTILFVADGWIGATFVFTWQIALFLTLREDFVSYGGALAIAAVVGALGGLVLGRYIDAGHGQRAVWVSTGVLVAVTLLRGMAMGNASLAVLANALGALVTCLYAPTLMTAVYNLGKQAPCTLRFHVATEGGWDAGGSAGCLTAALLIWWGAPLPAVICLALLGIAAAFVLLRRYYTG